MLLAEFFMHALEVAVALLVELAEQIRVKGSGGGL
jgi:hypothetical protein